MSDASWINQYDQPTLGFVVHIQGAAADPDGSSVTVTMTDSTGATVFTGPATRVSAGTYETTLTSAQTSAPGDYTLRWAYLVATVAQHADTPVSVGDFCPDYASLPPEMQDLVETTWSRFADTFDSPDGGLNLATYLQTKFTRNRFAQLLRVAVGRLNTVSQPYQSYTVDVVGEFPIAQWGALLEKALFVETLKHVRRSYVEQPLLMGGEVTRHDRRDYMDRWGQILQEESAELKQQLDTFKIRNMMLGKPQVLVSGGVFGRVGPTRYAGSAAARPRFIWSQFYTVLVGVSISLGLCLGLSQQHSDPSPQPTSSIVISGHTSIGPVV